MALKKNRSFRLLIELIERLKQLAKLQNRSLKPNATTLAAMKEVESGALRNEPALDLSSIEAMKKSTGL